MKILLLRHGESQDDIINAYGGWADFPLTEKGKEQIKASAEKIHHLGISFDKILSSPLKRAQQSAEILSEKLSTSVEILEYIKERNTYGILCGMVKADAKEKYPWLVGAYDAGEYVDGSEREEDIKIRARKAYDLVLAKSEKSLILVTHGNFLKAFIPIALPGKKLSKKEDGGFLLFDTGSGEVFVQDGLEVE
jgi:2,3-bisphosphoglycerate-dependent phosphoglycerate mutase